MLSGNWEPKLPSKFLGKFYYLLCACHGNHYNCNSVALLQKKQVLIQTGGSLCWFALDSKLRYPYDSAHLIRDKYLLMPRNGEG